MVHVIARANRRCTQCCWRWRLVAESVILIEREEPSPIRRKSPQAGSAYIGDQKVKVTRLRLRDVGQGEVPLKSYARLHATGDFSEELLEKILRASPHKNTPRPSPRQCGPSVCRRLQSPPEEGVGNGQNLKTFQERSLAKFMPFARRCSAT